jgi:hypothetical protein
VFAFTGHAVLALADELSESTLSDFAVDGFGGAHDPRLVSALAGADGWIDSLDLVLAGRGTGPNMESDVAGLVPRPDLANHPRARYAATIRSAPSVFGYSDSAGNTVVIFSKGVAGLTELSFELDPSQRGTGQGTALVRDALRLIPDGELVVASVAPGNAASLRCLLATGFMPLGSIQLFRRAPA